MSFVGGDGVAVVAMTDRNKRTPVPVWGKVPYETSLTHDRIESSFLCSRRPPRRPCHRSAHGASWRRTMNHNTNSTDYDEDEGDKEEEEDQAPQQPERRRQRLPNILITGTPGVGKTCLASLVAERIPTLQHLNVGEFIQQHQCYEGRDETLDTYILDEEKLLDLMEPILMRNRTIHDNDEDNDDKNANDDEEEPIAAPQDNSFSCSSSSSSSLARGFVVDYHSCELFPERWFDLVLVLQTETQVLFDRLTQRGYSEKKRSMNMECEIMQVLLEEAYESYDTQIVQSLPSNTCHDMQENVNRIQSWYQHWIIDHNT